MGPQRPVQNNDKDTGIRPSTKMAFLHKFKRIFIEKSATFLNTMKTMKKMSKLFAVTKHLKRRFLKKIVQNILNKITFNLRQQALHRKITW